ncbi:hypothetical protein ACFX15_021810 [Malus domestica]
MVPFKCWLCVGQVAYTLVLFPQSCIQPTFHVSLLKPKLGAHTVVSSTLSSVSTDGAFTWFPEAVLQRGMFKHANKVVTRWLIKWKGLLEHNATWEDVDSILARFAEFVA